MGKTRYRILGLAAVLATATACSDTSDEVVTLPDGAAIQNDVVDLQSRSNAATVEVEYVASYDPATGIFDMSVVNTAIETPMLSMLNGEVLREAEQGLFCGIRTTSGVAGTMAISSSNIGEDPAACGFANAFPYSTLGVFCADVTLNSRLAVDVEEVYAEITEMTPSVGHNGYAFPDGTGVNPLAITAGNGAPSNALGLWGYGDMAASSTSTAQWVFEYTPEPFTFRGRVVGIVPETCDNGFDDNCDGFLDNEAGNGANCGIEAVDACLTGDDCASFNCDAGTCGAPLPEDCAAAGDEDGNGLEGCADAACAGLMDDLGTMCPSCGVTISDFGTYTGNVIGAGDNTEVRSGAGTEDVAWFFTPATTGDYIISTCGTPFDTTLGVYTGDCAVSGASIAFDDDAGGDCPGFSSASYLSVTLTAGTEYMIAAEPYSTFTNVGAGDVTLNIGYDGPETDFGVGACVDGVDNNFDGALDCEEEACFGVDGCAFPLGTCEAPATAVNGANSVTPEDVNSFHSTLIGGDCSNFNSIGVGDEFVFAYTATNDGTITIDTIGSTWDTVLYARHSTGLADLATCADQSLEVACNDDGAGFPLSTFDLDVVNGETYFLIIDAYGAIDPSDVGIININANEAYLNACGDGLDNDGDGNADCADINCSSLPVCATATLPYFEDFNTDDGGWVTDEQGTNDVPWEHGDPTLSGAFDGDAWATGLTANYNNSSLGFLRSPTFDVSGVVNDTLIVSFQIDFDTEDGWDGAQLVANIDGTDTVVVDGVNNWYNGTVGFSTTPIWTGDSAGYLLAEAEIVLPPGAATLSLNFQFLGDGGTNDVGVVIDDVTLEEKLLEDCTNGVDDNGDGAIDCAENFCLVNEPTCTETGAECAGGVDDDGDGDIDCLDSDCTADPLCIEAIPYFEDFEAPSAWQTFFGTNWVEGAPAGATINAAFSGVNSMHFTSYANNDIATIQSPIIDASTLAVDAIVTWQWWSNLEGAVTAFDIVQLQYSIDGAAFAPVVDGLSNWNPSANGGVLGFGNPRAGYEFSSATLTGTAGASTVQLQAVFNADGSGLVEGFSFDDVNVLEPAPEVCNDGTDEDLDGLIDCLDPDCWTLGGFCTETCDGAGNDEDGDGDVDCADADCAADPLCIVATVPYFEDFETNFGGYVGTGDWEYGTPTGVVFTDANSGTNAWGTTLAGGAGTLDAILTSPQFDFSGAAADLYLEFFYQFDTNGFTTEVRVDASIDGGTNWFNIDTGLTGWGNSTATFVGDCGDDGGDSGTRCWEDTSVIGWTVARADISSLTGEVDVRFRVYYDGSGNGAGREGFVIDDITVDEIAAESCVGGVDDDFDGDIDCIDTDCNGDPVCVEICYGGNDEDGDSLTDCADVVDCPSTDSSCLTSIDTFPYTADFSLGTEGWTTNGLWEFGTETAGDLATTGLSQGWVTAIGGDYPASADETDAALTSAAFDFTGAAADPVATFSYVYHTEGCCDDVLIQYSVDSGATYATLATIAGDGFAAVSVDTFTLTGAAGIADVTFRIYVDSDTSVQEDGFALQGLTVGVPVPEDTLAECADTADNDFDTLVDCLDDDCWFAGTTCTEVCDAGGFDEDGDGAIDCADTDCHGMAFGCAEDCSTAFDEDGNGLAGCLDTASCEFDPACFSVTVPYTNDFESGAMGWVGDGDWELGTPAGTIINAANSGVNAWVTTLAGNHTSVDSILTSPSIDLTGPFATNPYFEATIQFDTNSFNSEARFDASTDGGVTWTNLDQGLTDWGNSTATFGSDCGDNGGDSGTRCWEDNDVLALTTARVDLSSFVGNADVRIRCYFDGTGTVAEGFLIDDVAIALAPAEVCNDGTDEDFDGLIDCIDPDCSADPACLPETVPYSENFDAGAAGWGSVGPNDWELGTPAQVDLNAANSGANAWMTDLDADYVSSSFYVLQSPAFDMTGQNDAILSFFSTAEVEASFDEFGVFYSLDGGTTWTSVAPGAGTWTTDSGTACNGSAFSGDMEHCWEDDQLGWTQFSAPLSGSGGQADVRIRFEMTPDSSSNGEGWAIDDVALVESATEICNSTVDEDLDGDVDCADSDCLGDAACPDPSNLINFTFVTTGSFPAEKEYEVFSDVGVSQFTRVSGPSDTSNQNLADGCYYIEVRDTFGDGWDGYTMDVTDGNGLLILDGIESQNLNGISNDGANGGEWQNIPFGVNTVGCVTAPPGGP